MVLSTLPEVERLTLARVTAVPEWHPEHATFEPFPVHAWVVRHPEGNVLLDTGIGIGQESIDEWYRPEVTSLIDALAAVHLEIADIAVVVLSHLHFDHCGQQGMLGAPVYLQAAEHEAARASRYTVAEWAAVPSTRLRLVDGEEQILDGLRLLPTPGHSPGHQSVVIEAGHERVVLAAQCASRASELRSGLPAATNLHDHSWQEQARDSLTRIRSMAPLVAHLSHDAEVISLA
ncbi:MAG: N-acyl homoserine lactonase family protein [Acidimicrobiia bacterium]